MLTQGEMIVLNHHLTEWPDDTSFADILNLIHNQDESVSVWEPFNEWDSEYFMTHIKHIADSINIAFNKVGE